MGTKINFDPPIFPENSVQMGGCLPVERGAYALWYYYILATKNLAVLQDELPLEDDPVKTFRFQKLYTDVCEMYGVDPNECINYWPVVEKEIQRLNLGRLTRALQEGREGYTEYQPLPEKFKYPMKDVDAIKQ